MSEEIKPIDWDSLPKVWAWDENKEDAIQCVWTGIRTKLNAFDCLVNLQNYRFQFREFDFISATDPRIKTQKMRVITAEELNDVYCNNMRDFRFRDPFGYEVHLRPINTTTDDLSNKLYSIDRGKTWRKCEVRE